MSMTDWIGQLQQVLDSPIYLRRYPLSEWRDKVGSTFGAQHVKPGSELETSSTVRFVVHANENSVEVLEVSRKGGITDKEKSLVRLMVQMLRNDYSYEGKTVSGSEAQAQELGRWIADQLEAEKPEMLPDRLTMDGRLFTEMLPFLVVNDYSGTQSASYAELEKLLRSFLTDEVLLIPLKKNEWLILGPKTLLRETQTEERGGDEEESEEDSLRLIGFGLHEMLASEWVGDCHLAVSHPVSPAKSLVETVALLRETVYLGRKFHVGTNIHLPWLLHLERLLSSIPEASRVRFVEQALNRTDFFVEPETVSTLETFFSLDCNVSETAKKLYIHRNTLLYRLDKLKQESGLDVRLFRDAVLVKLILLLYKVTKRN
ncbi:PucR family transcriptional regulator [Paenibacillus beijingensis]|uniref:PucR C-terminal helix-turn-helix domain-containing protein n=1 Tax=Paenibacillus beijingensis TaxID=1126833 RepID=A0A0D5NJA4_9BACL|nr:helix-turn-helix domain-containing protein [Paenibacillus beijingensis]AJY75013.1 hypothetical protein VN24_11040 [Paenibacillus beijingensis]